MKMKNPFSDAFTSYIASIFEGLNITPDEEKTIRTHNMNSPYKRIDMCRAWRDSQGTLCIEYERDGTKTWFHYNEKGEWW